jgi:acetolactate synthase-1/2/3 large subunit
VRVADLLVSRLAQWGLDTCFAVTGGGAMHLNDAFGVNNAFKVLYMHHEQACSMAAEGYARIAEKPAVVNVTTGPGVINTLNGVFGAFTDSIPMVVISGQVRLSTMADTYGLSELRQLGDQEVRTVELVRSMVKRAWLLTEPEDVISVVDAAITLAIDGRPGPTWIDVPVDVQGAEVVVDELPPLPPAIEGSINLARVRDVARLLGESKRPLILAGTGVRLSNTVDDLVRVAEVSRVPVASAWSHDVFPNEHPLYAGRPGTIGTRGGNFVLQACDLLLVLGSRLNIRQTSYNFQEFAANARIIWIDIDEAELRKPFVRASEVIEADLRSFLPALAEELLRTSHPRRAGWIAWCHQVCEQYEPKLSDYQIGSQGINPYHFVMQLSQLLPARANLVCGNASACIIPFQVHSVPSEGRMFSNSGSASMGYDLPAAIGAALADPSRVTVCLAGDGSLMMNIQELQTLKDSGVDLALIILSNDGYLSIRQTQSNFFGREVGASTRSGIGFPDFGAVCRGFDLPVIRLYDQPEWEGQLRAFLMGSGPRVAVVDIDPAQEFVPRLKSRMLDGVIVTPALDDMYPHLDQSATTEIRAQGVKSSGSR